MESKSSFCTYHYFTRLGQLFGVIYDASGVELCVVLG